MKNIIICSDGTGNEYGPNNTNVVELFSCISKSDSQIAFYDPGIGTGGWVYNEEKGKLTALFDQATGEGLQKNVEDAYKILMQIYEEGDQVYLFGFSRGAFTVRALAGMIHKCGLLYKDNYNLVEYASKLYNTKDNDEVSAGFKNTFSRSCVIYFIGVWDTVESLVLNAGKKFHNAKLNPTIKYGYQALSIDEKRKDFPPYLWDEESVETSQTVEQVWFAGVHSDVGGWYKERGLANISLQWMARKAMAAGLKLDESKLNSYKPDPLDQFHESYTGFWKFRGRHIRSITQGSKIHKSVFERINDSGVKYKPGNLPESYESVES